MAATVNPEELVIGLYDVGEIGFMSPPGPDIEVLDPSYPEEVFVVLKSKRRSPHSLMAATLRVFQIAYLCL